jgi:2-dehydropantoate 2-reductase
MAGAAGVVRICVVGCGAIGSLFAAHLGRLPGAEVWAFDVSADLVRAINQGGLRLTGTAAAAAPVSEESQASHGPQVQARRDSAHIPPCELGIVAVKSQHTAAAMAATAAVFRDGAVCSLQNGIGNEEIIARYVPRVIRGTTIVAGHVPEPGVVHLDAPGDTWLGPFEPQPARMDEVRQLAGLLTEGGLPTAALADSRGAQWTKLIFNSATSPVAALTGLTMGGIGAAAGVRELVAELVAEGRAVAGALGITLDGDPMALIDDAAQHAAGHQPSMLQDVLARRPTEIGVLNEGIVRQARGVGIPVPAHQAVTALMHGLESSWG